MLEILKVGIFAYIFWVLIQPEMILHFYWKWINKLPDYLYKPLGGCNRCVAGQIGTWFYLIKYFKCYNLFDHIFFICGTILTVLILDKIIDYDS